MIAIEKLAPVLELLQRHGVMHIKMNGLEVNFASTDAPPSLPVSLTAPTLVSEPIKHENEELTNVMKLSDEDLVDRLFPVPTQAEVA